MLKAIAPPEQIDRRIRFLTNSLRPGLRSREASVLREAGDTTTSISSMPANAQSRLGSAVRRARRDARALPRVRLGGTPLGPSMDWPQSLRTTTAILLASRNPMFLWWGPGARPDLQRRLPPEPRRGGPAPARARHARARVLDRHLGRHRPADRAGDDHGRGDLARGPVPPDRAQRPARGRLVDVRLQPRARRRRPHRRRRSSSARRRRSASSASASATCSSRSAGRRKNPCERARRGCARSTTAPTSTSASSRSDGTVLAANRASLEFAGMRADDVMGRPYAETPVVREHAGRVRRHSRRRAPRRGGRVRAIRDGVAPAVGGMPDASTSRCIRCATSGATSC